jgi:endoglucanase
MKLNKLFNTVSLAAVALLATGCNDTDAQYDIPDIAAPDFVAVTPSVDQALLFGEKTIKVKFDHKIGFATENTSKITLNGTPVKRALVLGADSTLTITVDVNFDKQQNLVIPAGLIVGTQGDIYDKELNFTWTINDLPANEATAITQKLGWGWNLGNHFDTDNMQYGYWDGATPSAALFQKLAAAGAKTVRIPATWTNHMDENQIISADYLNEVAAVVDMANAAGLNALLNTHHDSFETGIAQSAKSAEQAQQDSALITTVWTQIANRFKDYSADKLFFETFNEVHGKDADGKEDWGTGSDEQFDMLNQWNQWAVNAIRSTGGNNATRWIGVSGYAANIDLTLAVDEKTGELANFKLPNDPANHIMVGVHCYDPYNFCLHPVDEKVDTVTVNSWGHNADPNYSVSGANEEYIFNKLYRLRTTFIEKGIPCYLGEYGCVIQRTESANAFRKYYLEFFCRVANLVGLPIFVWDNNVSTPGNEANGYFDHSTGDFVADGATIVPLMINAWSSNDNAYDFYSIWNKSPEAK